MTQLDIDRADEERRSGEERRGDAETFGWKKWLLGYLGGVLCSLTVAALLGWVGSAGAQDRRLYAIETAHALLEQRVTATETLSRDTNTRMRAVESAVTTLVAQAEARSAGPKKAKR